MNNNFTSYDFSVAGKAGSVCSRSVTKEKYSLSVIGEGLGGANALEGSRLAVEVFCSCAEVLDLSSRLEMSADDTQRKCFLDEFVRLLLCAWNREVEAASCDASEKSQYDTWLLGVVCGVKYSFCVSIGRCKCVACNDWGQTYMLSAGNCNSMAMASEISDFSCCFQTLGERNYPIAAFLTTESLASVFETDSKLYEFYRSSLNKLALDKNDSAVKGLGEQLKEICDDKDGLSVAAGVLLDFNRVKWEPERWEGNGRGIYIYNWGDMDQDSYGRYYHNRAMLPLEPDSYLVWIGRSGHLYLEILSVSAEGVSINYGGNEYFLTCDKQLKFSNSDYQSSYDGPWHQAEDTTVITLMNYEEHKI